MAFNYRYVLQIDYGFLMKEHLPRTQESLGRDCLEHHGERLLKVH